MSNNKNEILRHIMEPSTIYLIEKSEKFSIISHLKTYANRKIQKKKCLMGLLFYVLILPFSLISTEKEFFNSYNLKIEELSQEIKGFSFIDPDRQGWFNSQIDIMKNILIFAQKNNTTATDAQLALGDLSYMHQHLRENLKILRKHAEFSSIPNRISIKKFGAIGDGKTDDGPAIHSAIAALSGKRNIVLFFPEGKYLIKNCMEISDTPYSEFVSNGIMSDKYKSKKRNFIAHIILNQLSNITIEGIPEAEIIMGNPKIRGIYLHHCENVKLKNIKIDYAPTLFWQGEIEHVQLDDPTRRDSGGFIDIKYDIDGFLSPFNPIFYESEHPRARVNSHRMISEYDQPFYFSVAPGGNAFKKMEVLNKNTFRGYISYAQQWDIWKLRKGMRVVFFARMNVDHAVMCGYSRLCIFDNITIFASPSMAFHMGGSSSCIIKNCQVKARPETKRIYSTNADILYFSGCAYGHLVKNCKFMNNGDDFLNIHAKFRPAYESHGNELIVPMASFPPESLTIGNRIGIVRTSKKSAQISEVYKIIKCEIVKNDKINLLGLDCYRLTLNKPIDNLVTLANSSNELIPDYFVVLETFSQGYIIEGNYFANGCSRILIGGRNGIFRKNSIIDGLGVPYLMMTGGLYLYNARRGGEYFSPFNIDIHSNSFQTRSGKSLIRMETKFLGERMNSDNIIQVRISNNLFSRSTGSIEPFFYLDNVQNISIENNNFENNNIPCPNLFYYKSGKNVFFPKEIK